MAPPYCYDYPRPAVTVDLVVFTLLEGELRVLLIRRQHPPFEGHWALPGGFLEIDEPIESAARRELREETGFEVTGPISELGVFGAPGRDPRGRTISVVYSVAVRAPIADVQGGDDASEARWIDPNGTGALAFDHDAILSRARTWLDRAVEEGPSGISLLPESFTADDVKRLFRALGKSPRQSPAWMKRQLKNRLISPVPGRDGYFQNVDQSQDIRDLTSTV